MSIKLIKIGNSLEKRNKNHVKMIAAINALGLSYDGSISSRHHPRTDQQKRSGRRSCYSAVGKRSWKRKLRQDLGVSSHVELSAAINSLGLSYDDSNSSTTPELINKKEVLEKAVADD